MYDKFIVAVSENMINYENLPYEEKEIIDFIISNIL